MATLLGTYPLSSIGNVKSWQQRSSTARISLEVYPQPALDFIRAQHRLGAPGLRRQQGHDTQGDLQSQIG
jgi:hypothetical protein